MNPNFSSDLQPITLYRTPKSGHSHRVELMLSFLDLPYEVVDVDMANRAHKAPDFLKLNPFGQVPAIDDNGVTLSDSNAILVYLVKKYDDGSEWIPADARKAAEVQRWLSVASGEIASGPCAARLVKVFGAQLNYDIAKQKTDALFSVLEPWLNATPYLAGENITLADVAAYSYIAHAPEGGISLSPYPAIQKWLDRIESQPRFVGMVRSPDVTL